jgi:hypothetical protein
LAGNFDFFPAVIFPGVDERAMMWIVTMTHPSASARKIESGRADWSLFPILEIGARFC